MKFICYLADVKGPVLFESTTSAQGLLDGKTIFFNLVPAIETDTFGVEQFLVLGGKFLWWKCGLSLCCPTLIPFLSYCKIYGFFFVFFKSEQVMQNLVKSIKPTCHSKIFVLLLRHGVVSFWLTDAIE